MENPGEEGSSPNGRGSGAAWPTSPTSAGPTSSERPWALHTDFSRVEELRHRLALSLLPPVSSGSEPGSSAPDEGSAPGDDAAGLSAEDGPPPCTTVGIMFRDLTIDNLWVGGPAYATGQLAHGDEVVAVDGAAVSRETLAAALIGSDVPGSEVELRVRKAATGALATVQARPPSTAPPPRKRGARAGAAHRE